MKKILCFLSLLICASCGGSHPLTPDSSPTLTLYQGPSGSAQGVIAKYSGLEPTAFVDNGLVRIWYTSPTYIDSTYAPAGANGNVADGPNYGTAIYPFSTQNIAYMDMPVAAFVSAIQNNTPLTWSNQGMCIAGLHQSYVTLGPDGMSQPDWRRSGDRETAQLVSIHNGIPRHVVATTVRDRNVRR